MDFFIVNCFSLPRLLLNAATRRQVYVIGENFAFAPTRPLFRRVYRWALARGWLIDAFTVVAELKFFIDVSSYADRRDYYLVTREAAARRYRFSAVEKSCPDYAMAFKHVAANYTRERALQIFVLDEIGRLGDTPASNRVIGMERDVLAFYRDYFGRPPIARVSTRPDLRYPVNIIHLMMVLAFSAGWVASRIRPRGPHRDEIFLGIDYTNHHDQRGRRLIEEISDPDSTLIYVFRNADMARTDGNLVAGHPQWIMGQGRFGPRCGLRALAQVLADCLRLGVRFLDSSPERYFQSVLLPYRRMRHRAFFLSHRCKFFLCRDDYNSDHSLRTQELRSVGGVSIGIMHGVPMDSPVEPSICYVDYDYYYIFGMDLYDRYYKTSWAPGMVVRAVGAWGMSREDMAHLEDSRPGDMIYFGRSGHKEHKIVEAVFQLAHIYPDKTFYVKLKVGMERYTRDYLALFEDMPPNVVWVDPDEDTYAWMRKVRYAIGSGSTAVLESIWAGQITLICDLYPEWTFYPRVLPGLCVEADEIVERFNSYVDGRRQFPFEDYTGLIAIDVHNHFDVIRSDMGLKLKGLPKVPNSTDRSTKMSVA